MRRRQFPPECLFSFLGRLCPHVAPTIADSMNVDIHTDARLAIAHGHHQVRRFPADPRQSDQLINGIGNRSSIDIQKAATNGMNGFGFRPVEPDGIDRTFDLLERKGQHGGRLMCQLKKPGTGFPRRLVFGPEAEEARNEYAKRVSIRVTRHHAENRLFPLPYLALDNSKRGIDLILAHGQEKGDEDRERAAIYRASPWKDAYSGLRFDNHF